MKIRVEVELEKKSSANPAVSLGIYEIAEYERHVMIACMYDREQVKIASAMLRAFPQKLIYSFEKSTIEITVPDQVKRLLKGLAEVRDVTKEERDNLLRNPTLEEVEKFLSIRKLLM